MVTETRRVVEDYILYKIHSSHLGGQDRLAMFPSVEEAPSNINTAVRKTASEFENRYKEAFPDLLEGIRSNHIATCDIDRVFSRITKDLFMLPDNGNSQALGTSSPSGTRKTKDGVQTTAGAAEATSHLKVDDTGSDVHVKWGHVISLLVFAGLLAVRCVETNVPERVDSIVDWVSYFLDTKLERWLERNGGWSGFAEWHSRKPKGSADGWLGQIGNTEGVRTAVKVGVMAAFVGLGAMMMSRR